MNRFFRTSALLFSLITASAHAADEATYPAWSLTDSQGQVANFPVDINKPTLILYWASWCPYCKALMPHLQSVIDEHGVTAIDVWAINVFENDKADPSAHLEERAFQFRLFEQGDEIARSWNVHATPGLFLTDDSGKIVWHLGLAQQPRSGTDEHSKHWQVAARKAPYWAAEMRKALRGLPKGR